MCLSAVQMESYSSIIVYPCLWTSKGAADDLGDGREDDQEDSREDDQGRVRWEDWSGHHRLHQI